jgi:hypothetical protein
MAQKKSKSPKTKKASIIKKATGQKKKLSRKKVVKKKGVKKNLKVTSQSRKKKDTPRAFMTMTDANEIIVMLVGLSLVALLMISIS